MDLLDLLDLTDSRACAGLAHIIHGRQCWIYQWVCAALNHIGSIPFLGIPSGEILKINLVGSSHFWHRYLFK